LDARGKQRVVNFVEQAMPLTIESVAALEAMIVAVTWPGVSISQ